MQCACAKLSSVVCPAVQHFPTLSHKRQDFREKKIMKKNCVFCAFLSEIFLTLRRTERDMIRNVYRSSCQVLVILVGFYCNLNFLDGFL